MIILSSKKCCIKNAMDGTGDAVHFYNGGDYKDDELDPFDIPAVIPMKKSDFNELFKNYNYLGLFYHIYLIRIGSFYHCKRMELHSICRILSIKKIFCIYHLYLIFLVLVYKLTPLLWSQKKYPNFLGLHMEIYSN